eukprot:scaffold3782_cov301-Prasinococcus_capsulatus_cf.AAC.5
MMGSAPAGTAAAGAAPEAAPAEAAAEQTEFDVKLQKVDPAGKIKVIKVRRNTPPPPQQPPAATAASVSAFGSSPFPCEVRAATGLGLKEAKELVEGAPCVVKKALPKDEAESLAAKLKEVGGDCSVE